MRRASTVATLTMSLLAAGCAQLSPQRGFEPVSRLASERLGKDVHLLRNDTDNAALASLIRQKLAAPLQADDAVQISLLNNRALQATYWHVGIAEADLVQAGRLHNPVFNFERSNRSGDDDST